jgi:hypothetical protein
LNPWTNNNWKKFFSCHDNIRKGIYLRFDIEVNTDVKKAIKKFVSWIRTKYYFPIKLPIYVKSKSFINTRDGDNVVGSFFEPQDYFTEPYIRIATGDYIELLSEFGKDDALASILYTLSHEITHYYQWINRINMPIEDREKQADYYGDLIIKLYSDFCEHP